MLPRRSKQREAEVSKYILADTALSNTAKEGVTAYLLVLSGRETHMFPRSYSNHRRALGANPVDYM